MKTIEVKKKKITVELNAKKILPQLEDIEITPSTTDKVYKSENYYGYNEVLVKGVEGVSEDLTTELTEQKNLITTQKVKIEDIASALEDKMASGEITLQEKSVTPTTSEQSVIADNEYDGLSKVVVEAVTNEIDSNIQADNIKSGVSILGIEGTLNEGIIPSGTLDITDNGIYDVTEYASANVNIEGKEDLSTELNGQDTLISEQEVTIEDILEALDEKIAGVLPKVEGNTLIFSTGKVEGGVLSI